MAKLESQMSKLFLNLACGEVYIQNSNWINYDYSSNNKCVKIVDLLSRFPLKNNSISAIYCSHFLEHVPLEKVNFFLSECYRVIKIGGYIRIVTPDFVEMSKSYLKYLHKDRDYSHYLIAEIIDQLVRKKRGGILAELHKKYLKENNKKMIRFVYERNGKKLDNINKIKKISFFYKLRNKLFRIYIYALSFFYPNSFRNQNISFADIGENHQWLWDYHQLRYQLVKSNFSFVKKMKHNKTSIKNFPINYLDVNFDRKPKKGRESLYVEAKKVI